MIWFTLCMSKTCSPDAARFAPGVRASMALLLQCRVHLRHDLLGHELHRALRELRVYPVVARVVERAERPDLLAEGEDLLDHALHRAGENELRRHGLRRNGGIRLVLVELEQVGASAAHELAQQL